MAKAIMIQGTMSNAGKSLITAGLLRVFAQDGYKAAPFKSQNMALNSFITEEGLEMGRAQVVQAQAAGIKPSVRMNPILLKPTNDMGSQVIVNGKVKGTMPAREYFAYKKELIPDILKAYESLAREYDIIVIEGAGSPSEINLKKDDIVNMGLAKLLDVPVLLVGDIDRGGVFAQLTGTVMLLEGEEKERIKGLLINKFRGDPSILEPGIEMLKDYLRQPVLGVLPYMQVDIEDEDSLSSRLEGRGEVGLLDIAVLRFPRISNFTDFNPLEAIEGVSLRYVHQVTELKNPDLILLPGSKNTMSDLRWLRQSGLEAALLKKAQMGTCIMGICGGYQMLGERLMDPFGVEEGGEMRGIGLLPMETTFSQQKVRTQVKGSFSDAAPPELSGLCFEGYEIHMGKTKAKEALDSFTFLKDQKGKESADGALKGQVFGTYVHGIFDKEEVVEGFLKLLAARKGMDPSSLQAVDFAAYKESQYDILAAGVRQHMDIEKIYEIMGIKRNGCANRKTASTGD